MRTARVLKSGRPSKRTFLHPCVDCGEVFEREEFKRLRYDREWLARTCKECFRQRARRSEKRYKYNLTPEELAALPDHCMIFGCKNLSKLCIDHDHKTGKVRGVL